MPMPQMSALEIMASIEAVLAVAATQAHQVPTLRERRARAAAPRFAETYPALFEMCARATTAEDARRVREIAGVMVRQLQVLDDGGGGSGSAADNDAFKDASTVVGEALRDAYVPIFAEGEN